MKLVLILSLFLTLACKKKEESISVEPAKYEIKQAKEDTVYYPSFLKPCLDDPHYKITKDLDDLKSCTNINRNDLFGEKDYYSQQFGFINGSNVNVRKGPGKEYEKIGTVEITYRVNLLAYEMDAYKSKWYLVHCSPVSGFHNPIELKSLLGWVNSEYVSIPSDFLEATEIKLAEVKFNFGDAGYKVLFNENGSCTAISNTKEEYGGTKSHIGKVFQHKDLLWCKDKLGIEFGFFSIRDGKLKPEFYYQGWN